MRKLVGVVLVLALGMLLSGCYVMRTLTFTKDTVDAGTKTTAKISVSGEESDMMRLGSAADEIPFFFVVSELSTRAANGGTLDPGGVFDGPVPLQANPDLVPFVEEECEATTPIARRGPEFELSAAAPEEQFDATNDRKFFDAELKLKASEEGNGDALLIFMGSWQDDGDGVPEDENSGPDDDQYDCQPPYLTVLKIKGGAPIP